MDGYKHIELKRSRRKAYLKLTSTCTALLYVPGLGNDSGQINLKRTKDGAWIVANSHNYKMPWEIDVKDIYGKQTGSVESLLNEELSSLVNEAMFDESLWDQVP